MEYSHNQRVPITPRTKTRKETDIIKGAHETDQIEGFKENSDPNEAAARNPIGSPPVDHVDNGSKND